jgi:hypothetical protein
MNDGTAKGLRIAVAAVLAIVLVAAALLAWMDISEKSARRHIEGEVSSFCESVPLGIDQSELLGRAAARNIKLRLEPDGVTYKDRRRMPAYNEISCEFKVDAAGTVVSHTFHPYGGNGLRRAASAASISG